MTDQRRGIACPDRDISRRNRRQDGNACFDGGGEGIAQAAAVPLEAARICSARRGRSPPRYRVARRGPPPARRRRRDGIPSSPRRGPGRSGNFSPLVRLTQIARGAGAIGKAVILGDDAGEARRRAASVRPRGAEQDLHLGARRALHHGNLPGGLTHGLLRFLATENSDHWPADVKRYIQFAITPRREPQDAVPLRHGCVLPLPACRGVCRTEPLAQDNGLVLYGAGSLREAMTEMATAFARERGVAVRTEFGASGRMRERIEAGDRVDVFTSADLGHAAQAGRRRPRQRDGDVRPQRALPARTSARAPAGPAGVLEALLPTA